MCSLKAESSFTISSWDLRAWNWKLFIGSYIISLYLDSVMPTHKLGSYLTWKGLSSYVLLWRLLYFLQEKSLLLALFTRYHHLLWCLCFVVTIKKTYKKGKLEKEESFSLWTAKVDKLLLVWQIQGYSSGLLGMSSDVCNNNVREIGFCASMTVSIVWHILHHQEKIRVSKVWGSNSPWHPIQPDLPRAAATDKNVSLPRNSFKSVP